jgi:NTP pyrophosphatase (non-canonical NTP hydrolase)
MVDLRQKELHEWQKNNFGVTPEDDLKCTVGMAEELGELSHWILKTKQKIREGTASECKEEIADAFGDVMIYGIQLMTTRGIDAEKAIEKTIATVLKRDWRNNPSGNGYSQHKEASDGL